MKIRFILIVLLLLGSAGLVLSNWSSIVSFKSKADALPELNVIASELSTSNKQLSEEYFKVVGTMAPQTLEQIISYITQYGDADIAQIQSFSIDGDSISVLDNITSIKDSSICDGYVITVNVKDTVDFVQHIDSSNILLHSLDIMLGAESVVLRARVGGVVVG